MIVYLPIRRKPANHFHNPRNDDLLAVLKYVVPDYIMDAMRKNLVLNSEAFIIDMIQFSENRIDMIQFSENRQTRLEVQHQLRIRDLEPWHDKFALLLGIDNVWYHKSEFYIYHEGLPIYDVDMLKAIEACPFITVDEPTPMCRKVWDMVKHCIRNIRC
jgi:hypothetical protein